ncbi:MULTISPECIES: GAF domain-containing protein [unclassified Dokdonia]|jgi:L-methionine (R)-S-oxide reductase|uniref:GAF domain-containing protein n=1 Tax=unclassified Dokdonia TaxID=2615033 RepID=UPI00020A6DA1|nr:MULTISPECIES: GAF domain-containing protein [unclassified Dokdonia]AEE19639.1 putative GAF sensor protein [Dokdonia sp. 4H-3-7-5]AWH73276.1 GAF domain-containing protein [Dokdonia sp. Dokd-P16]|tara:strand:+ start:37843 stop:38298 length:456 start_codon:yes stop_codon:yes gene_type:complete
MAFEDLKIEVSRIADKKEDSATSKMTAICELLRERIEYYDWVGFYMANHEKRTLHLEAFAGEPTDHTVIPFGKGICGQVAESNANFVVPDVKAQDNYIACSITVKSEIVIPLFKDGKNIGQIDIDSSHVDPFTKDDEDFLEFVNVQVAALL